MSQHIRQIALIKWLSEVTNTKNVELSVMTGDAGFRRYYRFTDSEGKSLIAVDSPKDKCNNLAFKQVQQIFLSQEINVPRIVALNETQGFFCLSDLGSTLLADELSKATMPSYYKQAMSIIPKIATSTDQTYQFPLFDHDFVEKELTIFTEWLLHNYLDILDVDSEQLAKCFNVLIANALAQPQVVMHRDFHSRNLMLESDGTLAVIDFQDAVIGPITYDVVSLLRDCYVRWPNASVYQLLDRFIEQCIEQDGSFENIDKTTWYRWFDLTGLQRHVKAAGIFARLHLRDGKPGYLTDIPLTLEYIKDVSAEYPELSYLHDLTKNIVIPAMERKK